ncbi:MAG TPA: BatD family protein, partial [Planctomycetota bacterium]|nr:BatD family protein [Planctomycetota bacterium]
MRALLRTLAPLVLAASLAAQGQSPTLKAHLTSGVVTLGDSVTLVVSVEDSRNAMLGELPQVEGLRIGPAGPPSHRVSNAWLNGRHVRSEQLTWAIPVRPLAKGEFKIPPFEVRADGRAMRTSELALTVVEDLRGADLGFIELVPSSRKVVEGQPFSVELVFGWDRGLQERINAANLSLPWWGQLPGLLEMPSPPAAPGSSPIDFPLNSGSRVQVQELAPRTVRGRPFRTFRLVRSFTPTRSGELEFPTSFLMFGHSPTTDIFGRSRERAESYYVSAEGFRVDVVPLPEQGRPFDYGGAIGKLSAHADADPRDVDAGESIKFSVTWTGQGNLEFFEAPDPSRVEAFEGFRVYGRTESKGFDRRTVVYDLAPLSGEVRSIPPLPLPVYDPEAGRYTTVATVPIPIRVRPLEGGSGLGDEAARFARDIRDIDASAEPGGELPRPGAPAVAAVL